LTSGEAEEKSKEKATVDVAGINAKRQRSDCSSSVFFFFFEIIHAPRERKGAGIMPPAAGGAASPWFTGRAQKPADGEVSLTTG